MNAHETATVRRTVASRRAAPRTGRLRTAPLVLGLLLSSAAAGVPFDDRAEPAAGSCDVEVEPLDPCAGDAAGDAGAAPGAALPPVSGGNPISFVTGAKRQAEVDLALDDAPIGLRRHYASASGGANAGLGRNWRHTWMVSLARTGDGTLRVVDSTGRHVFFDVAGVDAAGRPAAWTGRLSSDGRIALAGGRHEWHVPDGRVLRFAGPRLARIDYPGRRFVALTHGEGGVTSVTDEIGRTLRFEYAPGRVGLPGYDPSRFGAHAGHLTAVVLPDGSRVRYDYDHRQNLTRVRFADGTAREYHYEDPLWPNHLTGLTDRTGRRLATWTYDHAGRAVSSEHAGGVERVRLSFDAPEDRGDPPDAEGTTTVADSLGAISLYRWRRHAVTGAALLLEASGPGCATCPATGRRYEYTPEGRLASATALADDGTVLSVRRHRYDDRGRRVGTVVTVPGPDGGEVERAFERIAYEGDGHRVALRTRPSVAPGRERTTEIRRDADGLPLQVVERGWRPEYAAGGEDPVRYVPIERTVRLVVEDGRPIAIDGPRTDVEDVTRLVRDETGRLVGIAPPDRPALRIERFDAFARPVEIRLGGAGPFVLARDADGRVTEVRQGDNVVRYAHDAEGRLVAVTDPDGRTTRSSHDAAGRLVSVTDDLGRTVTLRRDTENRLLERSLTGADGTVASAIAYVHDAGERLGGRGADRTDGGPSVDVDADGRAARLIEAGRVRASARFDAAGRDVSLADARGNVRRFPVDDFGHIVMEEDPDVGRTRYRTDAAGNRVEVLRPDGTRARLAYDAANRPVERVEDGRSVSWRYGGAADGGDHGRLVRVAGDGMVERFERDGEGRLVEHVREIDGLSFRTGYGYDARGRLAEKRLPDGQRLRYHYREGGPEAGDLRAVTRGRWWGLADETVVGEIDADARDGESGYLTVGGVRTQRRTTAAGAISELSISRALDLRYEFDADGRIVGIDENGRLDRYAYASGRLSAAETATGRMLYRYDEEGNRVARSGFDVDGALVDERHEYAGRGAGNRLLATRDLAAGTSSTYRYGRGDGAPTEAGALSYAYDADRRPIEVRRDGRLVATYAYNPFGERVRKTVHRPGGEAETTYFLYDGTTLAAEANGDGEIVAQYVHLDGFGPVARIDGDAAFGIHLDHRGAPRLMHDAEGRTVWSARYAPFGGAVVEREDVSLALRLPGQYADVETGTHHNYLRDYDPRTGRYLTSDPIGRFGGPNGYAYVNGDPLGFVDPLGLDRLSLGGDLGGLHDVAADALERGAITEERYQQALEGLLTVPKPGPESEFATKLGIVLSRAHDTLSTDPRYTDRRVADLVGGLAEAAPAVAGMVALYSVVSATQPQLAIAFTAAAFAYSGYEATRYFLDAVALVAEVSGTGLCDADALNALGDRFAERTYRAGIDVASGAILGGFGAVASVGRRFAPPPRSPGGVTREEFERAIEHELNLAAARPDSPIKRDHGVGEGTGRFTDYRPRGNLDVDAQRHVLEGERNAKGKMVGGHWLGSETVVVDYDTSTVLPSGAISASVKIWDPRRERFVKKANKGSRSTFFPPDWSPERILREAGEASQSVDLSVDGLQTIRSPSGLPITFRVTDGKIPTFYPGG